MGKSRKALVNLVRGMIANDDILNDDNGPNGSQAPTGDDYNVLFDLVMDAANAAGVPIVREVKLVT